MRDAMGPDAKIIYAEDAQGIVGKKPEPDAYTLSGDFIAAALRMEKRK